MFLWTLSHFYDIHKIMDETMTLQGWEITKDNIELVKATDRSQSIYLVILRYHSAFFISLILSSPFFFNFLKLTAIAAADFFLFVVVILVLLLFLIIILQRSYRPTDGILNIFSSHPCFLKFFILKYFLQKRRIF